ncbi:WD40/YVTN/BNR-like repeat-containing protein [Piscinibacter defluvii]|uniref:WD40/YVTN/BNR-like repeat-containing protein n=1 Tax=Piscinibacter defluvii TaxID=1796922 RepID=UPI000FDD071F|nr:hypothetical protein [Piscinibacter defluvii]
MNLSTMFGRAGRALAAAAALAATLPAGAGGEVWDHDNGPFFGSMQGLAFGPAICPGAGGPTSLLLAAVDSGVWAGCGGKLPWRSLGAVIWAASVATDPVHPARLYVAGNSLARGTGFLRSSDGGNSWQLPEAGLPFAYYNVVKVDPARPSSVLVGGVGGVFRSTDRGATWAPTDGLPAGEYIASLALHGARPGLAFAAGSAGVYRSSDGGRHWARLDVPGSGYSSSVALHATRHATTVFATIDGAVWLSSDRGASWSPAGSFGLPAGWADQVAVDPSAHSPAIVYARLFDFAAGRWTVQRSADGGGTWQAVGPTLADNQWMKSIAVDPRQPSRLYATTALSGLLASDDSGQTWQASGRRMSGVVARVAVAPSAPSVVYAASYNSGPFRSRDGGRSWTPINRGLGFSDWGYEVELQSLAVDPRDAATVYVGSCCGVFGSNDGGETWTPRNDGQLDWRPTVQALAVDPNAPATLYAGTLWGTVFKTTDARTWVWSGSGLVGSHVYAIAVDPQHPGTVYASLYDGFEGPPDTRVGHGVFKSTDGGANWLPASQGLGNLLVRTLAVDPLDGTTVYAGTHGAGVFKSVDGGASWVAAGAGAGSVVAALAIEPNVPGTLYAATYDAGVFRSTDAGRSWTALNRGLDVPTTSAQSLSLDPTRPGHLFLATFMDGVAVLRPHAPWR